MKQLSKKLMLLLAVLALIAAACSSDDDDSATDADTGDTAAEDTAGDDGGDDDMTSCTAQSTSMGAEEDWRDTTGGTRSRRDGVCAPLRRRVASVVRRPGQETKDEEVHDVFRYFIVVRIAGRRSFFRCRSIEFQHTRARARSHPSGQAHQRFDV